MLSLSQIDAAFTVVRRENPDLDIEVLSLDDLDIPASERAAVLTRTNEVRSALVARVADNSKPTEHRQRLCLGLY